MFLDHQILEEKERSLAEIYMLFISFFSFYFPFMKIIIMRPLQRNNFYIYNQQTSQNIYFLFHFIL